MAKMNVRCTCGLDKTITERSYKNNIKKYGKYKCLRCIICERGSKNGDGMKNKIRAMVGHLYHDIINVACSKCGLNISIRFSTYKTWQKRHNSIDYICGTCLNRSQDRSKSRTDDHKIKCSERSKKSWQDPIYRSKLIKHLAEVRSLGPGPSNLEKVVWKILDDIGVQFVSAREGKSYTLGPWSFDIMIDRSHRFGSNKHLLIEIDGFYRHNRSDVVGYDQAKDKYVSLYHLDHELIRILEHEFLAQGKLRDRILHILGRKQVIEPQPIDLNNLSVMKIDFDVATPFLGAYHYLGFVNKRGIPIGAYIGDQLVCVALFAGITRDQTAKRLGLKQTQCRELIRFCISPLFHNDNLGSWFLSKSMSILYKMIDDLKVLVSFADNTVGHTGILYKAANFEYDGQCGPSYYWMHGDGWIMHKKTMWDHAMKNGISEEQMAEKSGYTKINCLQKSRFLYWFDKQYRDNWLSQRQVVTNLE
jgi:hypothetical protein